MPKRAAAPRYHDFGPVTLDSTLPRVPVALRDIDAPSWLNGDAIFYRFVNDEPTRLRAYADNRWIAPPAQLLEQAVRERLSADLRPRYWLELRLERFEQDFDAADRSRVVIRVRAVLVELDGTVAAQRIFQRSAKSSPDVRGAIHGLSYLGETAARSIRDWAASQADAGAAAATSPQ